MTRERIHRFIDDLLVSLRMGPVYTLRSVRRRLNSILKRPQLTGLFICPSHRCNADCVHCFEKFDKSITAELSTEQVKQIIDQFCELHGALVHFSSGEFLLRKDAVELIGYVRGKKIRPIVTTNGILLSENYLDQLKDAGLEQLNVSIDSADPATHDHLRGVKGCFDKAVNGLRMAQKRGITTYLYTYVTKSNYDDFEGVYALARELGVKNTWVFFPILSGRFLGRDDENLSKEQREEFRNRYGSRHDIVLDLPCEDAPCLGGGNYHICVMPTGDVTFCPCVPYSYGNISTDSLKQCLTAISSDYEKLSVSGITGQCPVNFSEFRQNCSGKNLYK